MMKMNSVEIQHALVYVHGFNSASQDEHGEILLSKHKLRILANFCRKNNYKFLAPNLDYQNLEFVVKELKAMQQEQDSDGLDVHFIGTSLGGFFAEYMAMVTQTSANMINPAINSSKTLTRYIGPCTNFASGQEYIWTQENCDAFLPYEEELKNFPDGQIRRLVLLDMRDELLDSSETKEKYEGKVALHTFEGGSHRFDHMHEALPMIKDSIQAIFLPMGD